MALRQARTLTFLVSHILRIAIFLAAVSSVSAQNTLIFNGPRDYPVGSLPKSVVVGDFNGDGRPEVAVANQSSNSLSVLLQNSDATFQPAVGYPVGNAPVSLQVGDFNKDGKMDLVVFNQTDNSISVLLGKGDGTFQAQIVTALAGSPLPYMVAGDFNGDGQTDVAIAEPLAQVGAYGVAVLLGNGDGTFQSPVTYAVNSAPGSLAVADLNGDGKLDLVTGNSGLSVLLGNGDGTFQAAINSSSLVISSSILLVADFNQDGHLDIATATTTPGTTNLTVFVGDGTGNFQGNVLPQNVIPLAAGDINGDGAPDLVVSTIVVFPIDGSVPIENLINNGDGTFTAGQSLYLAGTAGTPEAVLIDLNGDKNPDLVAALSGLVQSGSAGILSVVQGNGDGTFRLFPSYSVATGTLLGTLAAADYNNDGKPDVDAGSLALGGELNFTNVQLGSLLNDGAGFAPSTVTQVQTSEAGFDSPQVAAYVAAGDFNHDGKMDVAVAATAYIDTGVSILLGNGDGTFQSAVQYGAGMSGPIALGDFNGDGVLDVVGVSPNSSSDVSFLPGIGDGTFGFAVNSPSNSVLDALAVADFNHDSKLDVAALTGGKFGAAHQLTILLGNGDGTFSPGPTSSVGLYPTAIAAGDLNGDGIPDLVVANSESYDSINSVYTPATVGVLLGNGDGSFQNPITAVVGSQIFTIVVVDLNLDGKADVVLSNGGWNDVSVLLGNGDGTLQIPIQFFLGDSFDYGGILDVPGGLAVADFDGNGALDLAIAGANSIFLLLNVGGNAASAVISPNALAFGSEPVGQTASLQAATLSYMAATALNNIRLTISGTQSSEYQQTNTCGTSLAAGAHCTISVTFSPQATGLRTASIQISDSAGNSPQTIGLTGMGIASPSIGLGIPQGGSNSATITAGQTASYTLSIGGSGMSGSATLTCTGAPMGVTCSIPSTFTVSATAASSIQVSVTTTARSLAAANAGRPIIGASWVWGLVLVGIVLLPASWHKSNWTNPSLGVILLSLALLSSCGGSNSGSHGNPNGTPAGTYNLTVTADLNSATQTVALQLVVQ